MYLVFSAALIKKYNTKAAPEIETIFSKQVEEKKC